MSIQAERMLVKKLSEFAQIPTRGSQFAAGIQFSLFPLHTITLIKYI